MSGFALILAGLFLPLFPLSMVFNTVFQRVTSPLARILLLLIWPQIGIFIVYLVGAEIPGWIIAWALFSAALYGFRVLALRELSLWLSFIATSTWAIVWLALDASTGWFEFAINAFAFSAPLALLALIGFEIEKRFGAAYTGLYGGLATSHPRLSGLLVFTVLAIIATPIFPGFSIIMAAIVESSEYSFTAAIVASIVWLFWSWAGARVIQGLVVGPANNNTSDDLVSASVWVYSGILILLAIGGVSLIGGIS